MPDGTTTVFIPDEFANKLADCTPDHLKTAPLIRKVLWAIDTAADAVGNRQSAKPSAETPV